MTEAVRLPLSKAAISPRKSPGPRSATCCPSRVTSALTIVDNHELVGEACLVQKLLVLAYVNLVGHLRDAAKLVLTE